MKTKIIEIFNDYYIDLLLYLKKIKKYFKKIYRVLRYRFNNPQTKFEKNFYDILNDVYMFFIPVYISVKEYLLKAENRKKNLTTIGFLIIICLFTLISMPSFAIYQNEFEFSLINNVVGDKYASQFDYSLLIYIEDSNKCGKYNLTSTIPSLGYNYSGYKCKNNSILIYDNETKNTSVTTNQKDVCSVYFDVINEDLGIKIMLEDNPNSNIYVLSNNIPYYGYKYSHYECDNNSVLTYNSDLHKVNMSSTTNDNCTIYFNQDKTDLEVTLFIEETYQKKDYIEKASIPSNKIYVLNNENSECINNNNERIETEISYIDGYIEILSNEATYCKVYLDLANE